MRRSAAFGFGEAATVELSLFGALFFGATLFASAAGAMACAEALRFFAAVFLTDFLLGFFAGFPGAFLAAFPFAFLTVFFTVFFAIFLAFLVARLLLRLRFLAAGTLKARVFFVPRFFDVLFLEVFLAGVATTISFFVQMDLPGNEPDGRVLLHGFRKQAKYREN